MLKSAEERLTGLKTFFITPDIATVSEAFIELAFLHGYETYVVLDEHSKETFEKVEAILRSFKEVIIFFSIQTIEEVPILVSKITKLQAEFGEFIRLGVLYKNIHSKEVSDAIKKTFLFYVGITCGCIPMGFSAPKNQQLLLDVLHVNEAEGRRKSLRLLCPDKFSMNVAFNSISYEATLYDMSVSHFSCTFSRTGPDIDAGVNLHRIQLKLGGILCMVDARLALKRIVNKKLMYVFVFRKPDGKDGLDSAMKAKLNAMICKYYQAGIAETLTEVYAAAPAARQTDNKNPAIG